VASQLFAVYADAALTDLLLIAPVESLRRIFALHDSAVERIHAEVGASGEGVCRFDFNQRPNPLRVSVVYVTAGS